MKQFTGLVLSTKPQKTAVVAVDSFHSHPVYKKRVKKTKKYQVDNPIKVKPGDKVVFKETRPLSRHKKWQIVKIVK